MPRAAVAMTGSNLKMLMPSLLDSGLLLPNARCDSASVMSRRLRGFFGTARLGPVRMRSGPDTIFCAEAVYLLP